jgi:hypothetical protein
MPPTAPGAQKGLDTSHAIMLIAVMYFAYLIGCNRQIDIDNYARLKGQISHKEVIVPEISFEERIKIESVMADYKRKKNMNKSNVDRIMLGVRDGIVRGALGGAFMGKSVTGSFMGAVVFGAMGGIMKANGLIKEDKPYLHPGKFT